MLGKDLIFLLNVIDSFPKENKKQEFLPSRMLANWLLLVWSIMPAEIKAKSKQNLKRQNICILAINKKIQDGIWSILSVRLYLHICVLPLRNRTKATWIHPQWRHGVQSFMLAVTSLSCTDLCTNAAAGQILVGFYWKTRNALSCRLSRQLFFETTLLFFWSDMLSGIYYTFSSLLQHGYFTFF